MVTTETRPEISRLPFLSMMAWLRFDSIGRALRAARPNDVLEMGAGEGAIGAWLASRYSYTCVEPDDQSRAKAAQRLAAVGRGRALAQFSELGDERFDMVCAFEVLEHIEDDTLALEEWRERLRPRGWLLMSVPAHQKKYAAADRAAGHFRRYERADLSAKLDKTGYEVTMLRSYGVGFGDLLHHGRSFIVSRRSGHAPTPEERSSSSGRFLQPHGGPIAFAFAAIAAPFRLLQMPFAATDIGPGYVVLARRST
jgi:SAM-dependent methyltransferase